MNVTVYTDQDSVHRRFNPLTGNWVLVSPHRAKRPWKGQSETLLEGSPPSYDPACPLCPGNTRAKGAANHDYQETFVFTNDFAALNSDAEAFRSDEPLFAAHSETGEARVICYSPDHGKSLAELSEKDIQRVVQVWIDQCRELGQRFEHIQIFENKGAVMGCSIPHPHGQIWAQSSAPNTHLTEQQRQLTYWQKHQTKMLSDYAQREQLLVDRTVCENSDWIVVVPYWAAWPYETLLMPKFSIVRITELNAQQCQSLSAILKEILVRYDNLFQTDFPYSMGWHMAPCDGQEHPEWLLHAHFFPPLLRSATVKKFMVGYEMLAEPQRDITPEQAAERLKRLPDLHFRENRHA